ncbi:MAPEG family protein [Pacificimonas aurantium]|nr:MAPEG family protein [Pacificimonas aurantium]
MLQAVLCMGLLTLIMFLWMYATRLPAFSKAGIKPQAAKHPGTYELPSSVRQVADNYNHLFEAPTLFYAVSIAVVLLGFADQLHVICAWSYVVLRVVHSIIQASVNVVIVRFLVFVLSWVALGTMIVRGVLATF